MPVIPLPPVPTPGGDGEGFGPCASWEPLWCVDLPTGSEAISGHMVRAATELLWAKTGMQFDACQLTVRPCRRDCFGQSWPFDQSWWEINTWPRPVFFNGNWYNITCGNCGDNCSCSRVEEVLLPGPISSIDQVKVDGVVLTAGVDYRLDDWRKLIRLDGGIWPICNDLNLADSEVGTWSVTATWGTAVPTLGRLAVGELALQFIYACLGMDCCVLPQTVQQLTRQGVSIEFLDPQMVFESNRIGLQMSDMFISTYNPDSLRAQSTVYNIDSPRPRITGT